MKQNIYGENDNGYVVFSFKNIINTLIKNSFIIDKMNYINDKKIKYD